MTQIGAALSVLLLVLSARLLLSVVIAVQMEALLLAAMSGNVIISMAACPLIGLAGITPYILPYPVQLTRAVML